MKIVNSLESGDYHLHSATLSDGLNSIDEIAIQAGRMNYREIAITDHNEVYMAGYGFRPHTHYSIIASGRWKNIHNPVRVRFGVEADLLNGEGEICDRIQGICPDFVILSAHRKIFSGNPEHIKDAFLKAIRRYGQGIQILGHLCCLPFSDVLTRENILDIVQAANRAGIALELNCANLVNQKTDLALLDVMLSACDRLYVNSDAHTLSEFRELRQEGFRYLRTRHLI